MKKPRMILALLLALTIAAGLCGCRSSRSLSEDDKNRITQRFQASISDRGISGAVYAVYRGEVIFDSGAGMATEQLSNGSDVAYGVASLTKQFTAASVMQLFEQGKLDLNDAVGKYFPDYRYGDRICLKHLLSHRSGIPDYSVDSVDDQVVVTCWGEEDRVLVISPDDTADVNREKIREFFLSVDLQFAPGDRYDYSDSNFALLAEIVSMVSGMPYHDYVRKNIFEPLGMEHSAFIDDHDDSVITKAAQTDRDDFSIDYYTVSGAEYGCGDILTTPQDLYRWYRGLMDHTVVTEGSYELMSDNYSGPFEMGYGFGLMISDTSESKVVYHSGYIPSYCSTVYYIPEYDYFQAVLCNHDDGDPYGIARDMTAYFGSVIELKLVDID